MLHNQDMWVSVRRSGNTYGIRVGATNRDRGKPVLRDWLTGQGLIPWPKGHPPGLTLETIGGNKFRLGL